MSISLTYLVTKIKSFIVMDSFKSRWFGSLSWCWCDFIVFVIYFDAIRWNLLLMKSISWDRHILFFFIRVGNRSQIGMLCHLILGHLCYWNFKLCVCILVLIVAKDLVGLVLCQLLKHFVMDILMAKWYRSCTPGCFYRQALLPLSLTWPDVFPLVLLRLLNHNVV